MDYTKFGIEDISSYDHYIGFDLGHGEVSASHLAKGADSPTDLRFDNNTKDKIFTAIYIDVAGDRRIGDEAVTANPDKGNLYTGFKDTPQRLMDGEKYRGSKITKRELLQSFFAEAVKCLLEYNDVLGEGRSVIIVGCPAGQDWLENDSDVKYANLLKEGLENAGISNIPIVVVPESRAAIIKLQYERGKELDLTSEIMVFDLGSSTLDWSFLKSSSDKLSEDDSEALGGSLIEDMMLETFYDDEHTPDKLDYLDFTRAYLRGVKESFYISSEGRHNAVVEFGDDDVSKRVTPDYMKKITHEQNLNIFSELAYIQGSWASLCEGFMSRIAKRYELKNGHPFEGVLVLTGGVSRMPFVQEICCRVFPKAVVECDKYPSYSVSRGLSLFAKEGTVLPLLHSKPNLPFVIQRMINNMVLVEGGAFINEYNCPIALNSYYIGKYPLTQEEWKAVMGYNPSHFRGDNLPVENISWDDCRVFIGKLNQLTGLQFAFPTEAQWEFAARGGIYSKNYRYAGSNCIDEVAWCGRNAGERTHPVGQKNSNEIGLYDMSGNVWEWCSDSSYPYSLFRADKGGSCFSNEEYCCVSHHSFTTKNFHFNYMGFRLIHL